jgi:hypothetical protein
MSQVLGSGAMQGILFIEHTLRATMRAVRAVFLSLPIAGLIAAIVVEVSALLTTHHTPTLVTHILAFGFAIIVGYAVALTYAVFESVKGAIRVAELMETEFATPQTQTLIGGAIRQLEHTITHI